WDGLDAYRPRHDWVRKLIVDKLGATTLSAHHATLAQRLATWPARSGAPASAYALRHGLSHRAETGDWANTWRFATDVSFLEAKCRELGVHETEVDLANTAERCRATGDAALAQRFEDLVRALGRESHWLRAAPEATAALVWNRLRRYGWTASDLEAQLGVPTTADMLRVRRAATRESLALVRNLGGHTNWVTACAVTPDGRHVVSASYDHTLKVWDLASGRALATLEGHTSSVTACAVTPDGRHVVSASDDHTLKVWDLASGRALATLEGHTYPVTACAVTPDGRHVVSASYDQTLKVWDLASGRVLATLEGHTSSVTACAVTPDGRHVVSASWDQTLKVSDLASGRALPALEGHTSSVTACAVTPDGRHVVSASDDHTLKVWDLRTHACVITHRGDAAYLAVAVRANMLVAGDAAGAVWFLNVPPRLATSLPAREAPEAAPTHPILSIADTVPATDSSSEVDIGIVTIRDDEFRAVLAVFPDRLGTRKGARRPYTIRRADAGRGERYRIAVLRLTEQGQGEAQDAARDLIEELAPRLVLVVGIAGGRASDDLTLGDVVVSTRVHDFTVEARKAGEPPTYDVTGGPIDKALAALVSNLAAREDELGDWTADLPTRPPVSWTKRGQLYGPAGWQRDLRERLEHHHGPAAAPRAPTYAAGPIASSDRLVKDPELLIAWLDAARSLLAIEMESGGVYRAARERCPMLA